jgi:hypothetical protein
VPDVPPAFCRALNRIIHDGTATPVELAEAGGCSARHVRNAANTRSSKSVSLEFAEQISRWLVDERSETRQLDGFLGLRGATHFRPQDEDHDDCLLEEMARVQKHMARADDALKDGDTAQARQEMEEAQAWMKAAQEDASERHTT